MTLILILHALFGTSFPISKHLLTYATPLFLAGARMSISGLILLAYQYFWPTAVFKFKRKHFFMFLQISVFGMFATYALRFIALQHLPAGNTAFFYTLSPFISSLYAYIFFREKMIFSQWVGLLIGFFGMIPMVVITSPTSGNISEMFFISWPEIAVITSVILHSHSWILIQRLVRDQGYAPMMVNGICMASGGILALITSYFVEYTFPVENFFQFAGWLAAIIIISNIICHNMYALLLKKYSATFLAFSGFLGPIFAKFYSWAFLNEQITWHFFASASIVCFGLYMFYKGELSNRTLTPQPNDQVNVIEDN